MYKENNHESLDFNEYVRSRIDQLRMGRNISEYRLGLEIGKRQGYIQAITSRRAMPSMEAFGDICSFFGISPSEFFDPEIKNPSLYHDVLDVIKTIPESDLKLFLALLLRYKELLSNTDSISKSK